MSPNEIGAANNHYPKLSGWKKFKSILKKWTQRLNFRKDDHLSLYEKSYVALEKSITSVLGVPKFGNKNYDDNIQLIKNVRWFAVHKANIFTKRMQNKTEEEREAILSVFDRHLITESNFASRTARSVKQWRQFESSKKQYPNLEYLPSRSVNKRENHLRYYGVVLPINHDFWIRALPPNGWGCKCRVRQTDTNSSIDHPPPPRPIKGIPGNAGVENVIFSNSHPFFNINNKNELAKLFLKYERSVVLKWAEKNIQGKIFENGRKELIRINRTSIKKFVSQPYVRYWEKNRLLYDIERVVRDAKFVKTVPFDSKKKGHAAFPFIHYYQITFMRRNNYLVARENTNGDKSLYTITDKIKNKET